jgi:hypothetical protein
VRKCSSCGKPRENRHRYCRSCQRAYVRRWRAAGRERWLEEHARRDRARSRAAHAKKVGELVPQPCEVCGSTDDLEMHHPDYGLPLEVRWRCRTHHLELPKDDLLGARASHRPLD